MQNTGGFGGALRALLVVGCTLLAPTLAFAQVGLIFGDATVAAGDSGGVTSSISTDGSAVALQFDVLYDPAVVSLGTVSPGPALTVSHSIASNPISAGRDRVVITTSPIAAILPGVIANVAFAINAAAAAGTTALNFGGVVISDNGGLAIAPASLTPGTITITAATLPPVTPPPTPPPSPTAEPEAIPANPVWSLLLLVGMLLMLAKRSEHRARVSALLPLVAVGLLALPLSGQAQSIPGDANNDGIIDAQDVLLIVERILERGTLPGDGDCNRDQTINVLDTVCSQLAFVPGETDPIILGPGDRSIPAGVAFEMNLFAADPDTGASLSWELVSGPAALTVSTAGVLIWTPGDGDLGRNAISVRVTDNTQRAASATFTIDVFTVPVTTTDNSPPQLTVPGNITLPVGQPLAAQASASDPDAGDTLTFRLVNGPDGMSINPGSGAITWTPGAGQAQAADVVIEVTDSAGASDFGSFIVDATLANIGPTAVDDVYIARKGETLVIPAPDGVIQNDSDPNNDPLAAERLTDPIIGMVDSFGTDGSFSYTPSEPERITIGLELKCETDISVLQTHAGTASAADVDGDGDVELVGFSVSTLGAGIFIVDPTDCGAVNNPIPAASGQPSAESLVTLVNLDDDPELEVVTAYSRFGVIPNPNPSNSDLRLMAFNLDGSGVDAWLDDADPTSRGPGLSARPSFNTGFSSEYVLASPVAVDLDGDGNPELLAGYTQVGPAGLPEGTCRAVRQNTTCNAVVAWDGRTGEIIWEFIGGVTYPSQRSMSPTIVDLDMDGDTEIIWNQLVLDHEGNLVFELPVDRTIGVADFELYGNAMFTSAIGNFDNDAFPEIVGYDTEAFYLFSHDGGEQWRRPWNTAGDLFGARADLVLAELDGDPFPELVTMIESDGFGVLTLRAFDSDGEPLWSQPQFNSASFNRMQWSSPVAIDLDRDGIDELIQMKGPTSGTGSDDVGLYIIDGATGDVIWIAKDPIASSLSQIDEPLTVADIDGDGSVEIVTNFNREFGFDRLYIFDNLPGEPFPPGRPIRSQTNVQPTWVNADGSLPTSLAPHWLQPGRNYWNRIVPDLDPLEPEQDSFTYRISDGEFASAEATVNIEVRPNTNPPFFLSEPVDAVSAGIAYSYQPLVIDVDPGDVVSFSLIAAPAGMSINPTTGELQWNPEVNGDYPVSIAATDTLGLSAAQIFSVRVGDPVEVPDLVGQSQSAAQSALTGVGLALGASVPRSDPAAPAGQVIEQNPQAGSIADLGSSVRVVLSSGPSAFDSDGDGDGFTPNQGDCNDDDNTIFPAAPEIDGDGIDQSCNGIDGDKVLASIQVTPENKRLLTGEPQPLRAVGIFEDGTSQDLTRVVAWTRGPTFSSATPGSFSAEATLSGVTGSASFTVLDRANDDIAPVVSIDTPAMGDTVTAPSDVVGTVSDGSLLRWELAYRYAGEDEFILFAEGANVVSNNMIGEFDPTTLLNGLYTLRLRVYDRGGNVAEDTTTVQVEGQLKVGNFTLSFTDVNVPMAGVPIKVIRTYDSREKRPGDFGIGWTLDVKSVRLQTSRVLGGGWQVLRSGLTYALLPTDVHIVSLVFPDGNEEQFDMVVSPDISPVVPFPPLTQSIRYVPRAGTLGQLESLDDNNVSILDPQPGRIDLRLDNGGAVYDPSLFRYTGADGTQVVVDRFDGVRSITDPNGNTLIIADNGITHSAGKSVSFTRDSAGRITQITDPTGNSQSYTYDANGDLRAHVDEEGSITRFDYNANHGLLSITDPLGRVQVRNEYDDAGRIVRATNADGSTAEFNHDLDNRREIVTTATGTTEFIYDDRGNVTEATDNLGNRTRNSFDARDNRLSTINGLGQATTFTYDGRGNKLTETDPLGNTTTYTYNGQDKVLSVTDPLGRTTAYTYNATGNQLTETDPLGNVTQNSYDALGNLIAQSDALGNTTTFGYDAFGNLTSKTDARGNRRVFTHDPTGRRVARTDARGNLSREVFDARGQSVQSIDPLGNISTVTRDALGNPIEFTDPLGNTSVTEFDVLGREAAFVSAEEERFERQYDIQGNLTDVSTATGATAAFNYDGLGRVTGMADANGVSTVMQFDGAGRVILQTDRRGNNTRYGYDAAGRQIRITDPSGNQTSFTYDAAGNLVTRTDGSGNTWSFIYDALDRIVEVRYPDNTTSSVVYDAAGRVIEQTDQLGRSTTMAYDPDGNMVSLIDASGAATHFTYDEESNRITREDALGRVTRYVFDANNRMTRETLPDGTFNVWVYDGAGNQTQYTDANGNITTFTYDANGRRASKTFEDGSGVTYTYTASNQLASVTDARGTMTHSYDANNRLTHVTKVDGSTLTYTYDAVGNVQSITLAVVGNTSKTTQYTYDELNRLQSVTDEDGNTTSYTYDTAGNLATVTQPNGVTVTYTYDSQSRLTQLTHSDVLGAVERYTYTLDEVGNRTRVEHLDGRYTDYQYDVMDRLLRETQRDGNGTITLDHAYTYDLVGNRLSKTNLLSRAVTNYSYDSSNRLLTAGTVRYAYDANGNTTTKTTLAGTTRYRYDFENRLVATQVGLVERRYVYDDAGNLVEQSGAGAAVRYLIDTLNPSGFSQVVAEYAPDGSVLAGYTFGLDLISLHSNSGQRAYYHYDGVSSTRFLTNASGIVTDTYNYDAFGTLIANTGTTGNAYLFAGERFNAASSLYYLRARYYAPESGRFMTRDPFRGVDRDPRSLHRYTYVNNSPVNFSDYTGLFPGPTVSNQTVALTIAGGLISIGTQIIFADTRDLANYSPLRAAYRAAASAVLGAVSAAASSSAAARALPGIARGTLPFSAPGTINLGWGSALSVLWVQAAEFGAAFGIRSVMIAGVSSALCAGESIGFDQLDRSNARECALKGMISGVLFFAVGTADALRAANSVVAAATTPGTINLSNSLGDELLIIFRGWGVDLLELGMSTLAGLFEAFVGDNLPGESEKQRFVDRVGVDSEDKSGVIDQLDAIEAGR